MSRVSYAVLLLCFLLSSGCSNKKPEAEAQAEQQEKNVVQISRSEDAEAALEQLGYRAWVFKYEGGKVTSEVTIRYRKPGESGPGTIVERSYGDAAIHLDQIALDEKKEKPDTNKGMIVVTVPEDLVGVSGGSVFHSQSLNGASHFQKMPLKAILPKNSLQAPKAKSKFDAAIGEGSGEMTMSVPELSPGESSVFAKFMYSPNGAILPNKDGELLQVTVTITALTDGKFPVRKTGVKKKDGQ